MARDWQFKGLGVDELLLLSCLAGLCLWPGLQWYRRGMKWLPLGEAFAAMHLVYYVLPCLAGRPDWLAVPPGYRVQTLIGVGVFLVSLMVAYQLFLPRRPPVPPTGLLRRELGMNIVWNLFGFWLVWTLIVQSGWLPRVGAMLNVFRSVVTASGSIGIVCVFFRWGRNQLSPVEILFAGAGLTLGLILSFASGFLNGGAEIMGAALLAFTLGRKRLPVAALLAGAGILGFLQLGKGEFRNTYWADEENFSSRPVGLSESYVTWLKASWHGLTRKGLNPEEKQGLLTRTSLIQFLAVAMENSPEQKPFLEGQTYLMLPELLVPRIFWPEKPRGTLPTETLGIYYGIQNEEGADYTGIAVGPLVEGWANFGWVGLALAGAFFGVLFGLPARLSRGLTPVHVGWLLASVFLVYSLDMEHSIPEIMSSLLQALLMGAVMLVMVSREGQSLARAVPKRWRGNQKPADGRAAAPFSVTAAESGEQKTEDDKLKG